MRNLAIVVALLIVTACVSTMAYFYGSWVPNNPLRQYPVKGIDVSHHNGTIDWRAVADDGVKFAYIKATEGKDFQDDRFITNCRDATTAGVVCGAYHYFRLGPPAVDLETWGNSSNRPSVADFQAQLTDYLNALRKEYGTEPVLYASSDFIHDYLGNNAPKRLWYRAVVLSPHLEGYDNWTFWQYSERARVKGIAGFVDMDVFNGAKEDLLTLRSAEHP
jgi:lysozyme